MVQNKSLSVCWHSWSCWLWSGCPEMWVLPTLFPCLGTPHLGGHLGHVPAERAGGSCCFQVCNTVPSPFYPAWPLQKVRDILEGS